MTVLWSTAAILAISRSGNPPHSLSLSSVSTAQRLSALVRFYLITVI